jgi:hypothetical protein
MKRYKMDKWGQIPIVPAPNEGGGRFSVRAIFLLAIPIVLLVAICLSFYR